MNRSSGDISSDISSDVNYFGYFKEHIVVTEIDIDK
jgi:hypothetical protein